MKKQFTIFLISLFTMFLSISANGFGLFQSVIGDIGLEATDSPLIIGINTFDKDSGIAFTDRQIFRTDDNGLTWRTITPLIKRDSKIVNSIFLNRNIGFAMISSTNFGILQFAKTENGGGFWKVNPIELRLQDVFEADLQTISIESENQDGSGQILLSIRSQTSSNFFGKLYYESVDGGISWKFVSQNVSPRDSDIAQNTEPTRWKLETTGNCLGFKTGCTTESQIVFKGKDVTPPEVKELSRIEREKAKVENQRTMFLPPAGNTRISLARGFDKCTAATTTQMQTWWNNSPFYDANIYMSGRNRGCSQAQLNQAWVNTVTAQGWGLIPTIVGYQSPCSICTSCQKHSSDAATAETQGRGEADIAVTDATNLGLTAGSILYYDMERYDDVSGTGACSTPTKSFLKGWTDRVKELGYKSGVYGSPTNAQNDWVNIPVASQMDAVWLARWNNVMTTFGVAPLSDVFWANHQRIHQWLGPRDENWGGVTFNIDNNISDAPVVSNIIQRNKIADFDGDGKTDLSVYRPDTSSIWYVLPSINSNFYGLGFGISEDIITPGDYDGDGKTDYGVFRPSSGIWYIQIKAGFLQAQPFGQLGDIPVPADYDGDGKTDIALYRPSNGVWYIKNSFDARGTSFTFTQFGTAEDKPVQGDYDGDGKADIAVFRPSNSVWYLLRSNLGFTGFQFGISTDKPVQSDYDGDGKTDIGVFRDGLWYIQQSQAGFLGTQFGFATDKPSPGDFDGDGKTDIAVFRPSNGVWYLLRSQAGFTGIQFGSASDLPIPSAYIPQN
jgi:hypothetical protein